MNFTDKQIKLAGVIQPEGGAREFEQGLDLQGEGIRVLQNDRTIFEENTGDCCEDLQTCELALSACDAERTALEEENADLIEENQALDDAINGGEGSLCSAFSYYWPVQNAFTKGYICISVGEDGFLYAGGQINVQTEIVPPTGIGSSGTIGVGLFFLNEDGTQGPLTTNFGMNINFISNKTDVYTDSVVYPTEQARLLREWATRVGIYAGGNLIAQIQLPI